VVTVLSEYSRINRVFQASYMTNASSLHLHHCDQCHPHYNLQASSSNNQPSSPRPSSLRTSSRTNESLSHRLGSISISASTGAISPSPPLRIHFRLLLGDYLKLIVNLGFLTTDTISHIIEFPNVFNSRTCQVVLGAGAMRSAGLKNITAKHLALASQRLSIVIALIPHIHKTFRRHLSPKQEVMLGRIRPTQARLPGCTRTRDP
jgi:hypothetical protein